MDVHSLEIMQNASVVLLVDDRGALGAHPLLLHRSQDLLPLFIGCVHADIYLPINSSTDPMCSAQRRAHWIYDHRE